MNTNRNRHSEALHAGDPADTLHAGDPADTPGFDPVIEHVVITDDLPTIWGYYISDTDDTCRVTTVVTSPFHECYADVEEAIMAAFDTPYYRDCTFTIAEFAAIPF